MNIKKLICLLCVFPALLPPVEAAKPKSENNPEIRAAIAVLEKARQTLERGTHDAGGDRKKALEACDHAIRQLKSALETAHR